jgi:thiol-disulfide isomerase/thioredoxin
VGLPIVLLLVAAVAGCTADPGTPSPFAACSALGSGASPAGGAGGAAGEGLPDLRLPCFTGGAGVALRDVRGPAVINLWASWCGPCQRELPVMQRLADRAGGRVAVLGVDTGDTREAGASFAAAKGVSFPTLFDADSKLINALGRINLPITIFVDGSGRTYVNVLPLDAAKLTEMVKTHAGVAVTL